MLKFPYYKNYSTLDWFSTPLLAFQSIWVIKGPQINNFFMISGHKASQTFKLPLDKLFQPACILLRYVRTFEMQGKEFTQLFEISYAFFL